MEENKPNENPEQQFVCPYCNADPFLPRSMQYQASLPNGGMAILTVVGCSACRKALAGQVLELPPRIATPALKLPNKKWR